MSHRRVSLACAIPLLLAAAAPLSAQEWVKVAPETATSHLIKKVEPVYPAFAKAAGVQGAVSIRVGIGTTGRIGALMEMSGPPSLYEAARNAVLQYEYKPFEKDGKAAAADTTITIVFKLEGNVSPPPPPHDISDSFKRFERAVRSDRGRYAGFKCTDCAVTISPELRKWLASDLKKQIDHLQDGFESSPEFLSLEAETPHNASFLNVLTCQRPNVSPLPCVLYPFVFLLSVLAYVTNQLLHPHCAVQKEEKEELANEPLFFDIPPKRDEETAS